MQYSIQLLSPSYDRCLIDNKIRYFQNKYMTKIKGTNQDNPMFSSIFSFLLGNVDFDIFNLLIKSDCNQWWTEISSGFG